MGGVYIIMKGWKEHWGLGGFLLARQEGTQLIMAEGSRTTVQDLRAHQGLGGLRVLGFGRLGFQGLGFRGLGFRALGV